MGMTMREKMARAMLDRDHPEASEDLKGEYWWLHGEAYFSHADAALSALAEITPEMRKAGEQEVMARHTNLDCFNDPYVDSTFTAMINAAKGE